MVNDYSMIAKRKRWSASMDNYCRCNVELTKEGAKNMMYDSLYVTCDNRIYKPDEVTIECDYGECPKVNISCHVSPDRLVSESNRKIKKVIFNPPATVVLWADGTKTVVKAQNNEAFDSEKGLAMAVVKKFYGNKGSYFNEIKKWTKEGK